MLDLCNRNNCDLAANSDDETVSVTGLTACSGKVEAIFRQPNHWQDNPSAEQDILQVWFPGAHADAGGGYTVDDTPGLAGISSA